jgi:hypothetical protein
VGEADLVKLLCSVIARPWAEAIPREMVKNDKIASLSEDLPRDGEKIKTLSFCDEKRRDICFGHLRP